MSENSNTGNRSSDGRRGRRGQSSGRGRMANSGDRRKPSSRNGNYKRLGQNTDDQGSGSGWKRTFANPEDGNEEEDDDDSIERCIICDSKIVLAAVLDCQHTTCHVCTLRHRALFKKTSCIVCRSESTQNCIVTEILDKNYDELCGLKNFGESKTYKLSFTSKEAEESTLGLRANKCVVDGCGEEFRTFKKLADHARSAHDRLYCFICALFKHAFPCELPLYTQSQLRRHQRDGDKRDGFKGHPKCQFCTNEMFYSDDELNVHLREKHERCHVCDKIDSANPQFFKDYDDLSFHFNSDHYVCPVQACLDKKFVAFADDISLKAHMISEHPKIVGNDRTLLGSSGPLRPNGGNNRRYQSSLSTFQNEGAPKGDSVETKKLRMEERARHYLVYSQENFDRFLWLNKDYKNGKLTCAEFWQAYIDLFSEQSTSELALLVHEFVELLPNGNPKSELQAYSHTILREETNKELFPVLGGGNGHTDERAIWTANPKNRVGGGVGSSAQRFGRRNVSSTEEFPALLAPTNKAPVLNQNVRYKTLTRTKKKTETLSAREFASLRLSDSSASWAGGSGSASSKNKGKKAVNEEEFPSLMAPAGKAPKINRQVKYTTMTTTKKNGKTSTRTSNSSQVPGSSGVRITIARRPTKDGGLSITNHNNQETSVENGTWGERSTPEPQLTSDTSDSVSSGSSTKKKKQKQLLFRVGI